MTLKARCHSGSTDKVVVYISDNNRFEFINCYVNSIRQFQASGFNVVLIKSSEHSYIPVGQQFILGKTPVFKVYYGGFINRINTRIARGSVELAYFIRLIKFVVCSVKILRKYDSHVACLVTDPPGLMACRIAGKKNVFYYPQELFLWADARKRAGFPAVWSFFEGFLSRMPIATVAFDSNRASIYARAHKLDSNKLLIIPNSDDRPPIARVVGMWQRHFGLPTSSKIIMYSGEPFHPGNMLVNVLNTINEWDPDWYLVVYSLGTDKDNIRLAKILDERGIHNRVYIFPGGKSDYEKVETYYAAADVGLALYSNVTINHYNAGLSSGKMWNFLRAGVPVLVNNTDVCKVVVEHKSAGLCVGDDSHIYTALKKLLGAGDMLSDKCHRVYEQWKFGTHHKALLNAVERSIA